ncbi:MAG: transcriptional repressor LexA [Victivallaceae bacterium]
MRGLTEKQREILNFIEIFQERAGMPPTVQEIADNFNVKSSTIFAHLRALQRKNQLARSSKARSISLTHQRTPAAKLPPGIWTIPLLGRVSAGEPAESLEYMEAELPIPAGFAGCTSPAKLYALRIQGESMRDLGIFDGDIVIVTPVENVRPGDIVVALVQGGETTVKSYFPINATTIELRPANSEYQPQFHHKDQVRIQGRVLSLIRHY